MAITEEDIEAIDTLSQDIEEIIRKMSPKSKVDWKAFEKLVDAHKVLRTIDIDSLRQLVLPGM